MGENRPFQQAFVTMHSIMLTFNIVFNVLVIYIYTCISRSRYLNFQRLVFVLAVADFLKTLTTQPLYIYLEATMFQRWDYGVAGCKIFHALGYFFTYVMMGVLVIALAERTHAHCKTLPDARWLSRVRLNQGVFIVIVLSTILSIPIGVNSEYDISDKYNGVPEEFWNKSKRMCRVIVTKDGSAESIIYIGAWFLVFLTFLLTSLVFLNSMCCGCICHRSNDQSGLTPQTTNAAASSGESGGNTTWTVLMVLLLILFTYPLRCFQLMTGYNVGFNIVLFIERVFMIIHSFGGCVNFLLLLCTRQDFRDALGHIFRLSSGGGSESSLIGQNHANTNDVVTITNGLAYHLGTSDKDIESSSPSRMSIRRHAFDDKQHINLMTVTL